MASMLYQHLPSVIGVAGAGQMGLGISIMCAVKGLQVKSNILTQDQAHEATSRITTSVTFEPFRLADFVIEAVTEDEAVKHAVFKKLDQMTAVQTVLASNTSSMSITRLAAVTSKPHRVVGMHFQLPVYESPLVELAEGMQTSEATFTAARSLAEFLGKTVVKSEDRPGFILHRCLLPLINEAFFCLMEGTACAEDIDRSLKLGTSMKMGPLRLADSIGLDTCLSIMRVLHRDLGDSKYRPCPLLAQYVDAGLLGAKTGRGIFSYETKSGAGKNL